MTAFLLLGDCLEKLAELPDCSIDSIVTDPPYGLSFMGKKWDYDVPSVEIWKQCLRVLKPGGHLLAFAGARTQHRMAVNIEDAGFEIRDMIAWVYGSGFPKSLDVSKAIDKAAGAEREVVTRSESGATSPGYEAKSRGNIKPAGQLSQEFNITAPATPEAQQWAGWGTALKPALEPITVARKPLQGTVAANVLEHGCGGINVDGCRIAATDGYTENAVTQGINTAQTSYAPACVRRTFEPSTSGRWPANLIHDGSDEVVRLFPQSVRGAIPGTQKIGDKTTTNRDNNVSYASCGYQKISGYKEEVGSAARFFYCAKTSKRERSEGNNHPTCKPITLMRYLCRLVTPPGGTVLDPFMGSGSTGIAALQEDFSFIGIERELEYMAIAQRRIDKAESD